MLLPAVLEALIEETGATRLRGFSDGGEWKVFSSEG